MRRTLWLALALSACSGPTIEHQHERPIVEDQGRTWLWAGEDDEWFDVTDARIDPERFQYGIGKDRISSIDAPEFAGLSDARLAERGVSLDTPVLGVVIDGEPRAYPVWVMDMHEVVNDQFGLESYAVLW